MFRLDPYAVFLTIPSILEHLKAEHKTTLAVQKLIQEYLNSLPWVIYVSLWLIYNAVFNDWLVQKMQDKVTTMLNAKSSSNTRVN